MSGLTVFDWSCIFVAWLILAVLVCSVPHRLRRRRTDAPARPPLPPVPPRPSEDDFPTAPLRVIPPVPPAPPPGHFTDVFSLADQPVEVWLTDELADRLFADIIAMEGLQ